LFLSKSFNILPISSGYMNNSVAFNKNFIVRPVQARN